VLGVDRGSQPLWLAGDSLGVVSAYYRNGTLRGRIRVTEDAGGIRGLLRVQGQLVLYFSSHSFGFFSLLKMEIAAPPCTGWSSPVFDVAPDPLLTYSRVVVGLSDGDVLVFSIGSGKDGVRTCDLALKFPHLSALPYRLHSVRGHVIGLPTPLAGTERADEFNRELYFFNIGAMEAGYGTAPSRAVTFQASFEDRKLHSFSVLPSPGSSSSGAVGKVYMVLQFDGETGGLELYELSLKTPSLPSPGRRDATGDDSGSTGAARDTEDLVKAGILGIALVCMLLWILRKMGGKLGAEDFKFDDEDFLEKLKKNQLQKEGEGEDKDRSAFRLDDKAQQICVCGRMFTLNAKFCRGCGKPRPESTPVREAKATSDSGERGETDKEKRMKNLEDMAGLLEGLENKEND